MENIVITKLWVYPLENEDTVICTFALEWWKCRVHEPFVRDGKQVSYGTPKPVDGCVKLRRTPKANSEFSRKGISWLMRDVCSGHIIGELGSCSIWSVYLPFLNVCLVFEFYKWETQPHLSRGWGLGPQTTNGYFYFLAQGHSLRDSWWTNLHDSDVWIDCQIIHFFLEITLSNNWKE